MLETFGLLQANSCLSATTDVKLREAIQLKHDKHHRLLEYMNYTAILIVSLTNVFHLSHYQLC